MDHIFHKWPHLALVEDQLVFRKHCFVQQPLYCHYLQRMAVSLRAVDLSSARDLELWQLSTACSEMRSSVLGSTPTKRQNIKFHFHLASKTKISSSSRIVCTQYIYSPAIVLQFRWSCMFSSATLFLCLWILCLCSAVL